MTSIDKLANEIAKELQRYTSNVKEEVEVAKIVVAKEAVKELRKKRKFKNVSKNYYKGWRTKKVGNSQVIHNATNYRLTHLLEKGHVNRDGSRTGAFPHIAPVEEQAVKEFTERVEKAIKS